MNRRNVLLGLGGLAAVAGGAIGTGAFSQVTAQRSAEISVASDANAYLALNATNSSSPLVGQTSGNNTIAFDFAGGAVNSSMTPTGEGLNPEAKTTIPQAFEIANHGTQAVGVRAEVTDLGPDASSKSEVQSAITFEYVDSNGTVDLLSSSWTKFDVGEGGWVDVIFDLDGTGLNGDLVDQVTFHADANKPA